MKKILIALIVFIISITSITFAAPLNRFESNIDVSIFNNHDLLNSDDIYLTRGETIRCVFGILGADDELIKKCGNSCDLECFTINDLAEYPYPDEIYYYVIGEILNIAYTRVNIFNNVYLKYDKIMTLKEISALLQSCIQDTEDFIPEYATRKDIRSFYKNAKKSGIITKI